MGSETLKKSFLNFCSKMKLEKNHNQIEIIDLINKFLNPKKSFLNFFFKNDDKLCFYLHGGVGLGKTMILDHVYQNLDKKNIRS